jgi:hypothetical protein
MDGGKPRDLRGESVAQPKFEQDTSRIHGGRYDKMDLEINMRTGIVWLIIGSTGNFQVCLSIKAESSLTS